MDVVSHLTLSPLDNRGFMRRFGCLAYALLAVAISGSSLRAQSLLFGTNYGSYGDSWNIADTLAANFILSQDAILTQASIYAGFMSYDAPNPNDPKEGLLDQFRWAILLDDGNGFPGALIATGTSTPTITATFPSTSKQYTFRLPNIPVAGNQRYWLAVINENFDGTAPNTGLYWGTVLGNGFPGELFSAGLHISAADGLGEPGPNGWRTLRPLGDSISQTLGNSLAFDVYGVALPNRPHPARPPILDARHLLQYLALWKAWIADRELEFKRWH